MRNRPRGLSLPEILIGVMILSLMLGVAIRSLTSDGARASAEGLALVVTAELEAARGKAMSSRYPVAFCLPSDNGTTPQSQSFYLMEGLVQPRATVNRSFQGDFPNSVLAMVFWGSAVTLDRPGRAGSWPAGAVRDWLGDRVGQDYALVFLPDGSVMSNDLPLMDGEYRLLVCSGLSSLPETVPGRTWMPVGPQGFRLLEAFAAHTVCISPQGEIRLESGVYRPENVRVAMGAPASSQGLAISNPPAAPPSSTPEIATVAVFPKPFLEPKATVQQERNLSLTATAREADGQQLFCTWKSEPVGSATGTGAFSLEDRHPMVWDSGKRLWTSQCTWAPPKTAQPGDQYVLTCRVEDTEGNEATLTADILNPVTVIPPGRILFEATRGSKSEVAIINADGTGLRYLTDGPQDDYSPAVSPDGSKIAWVNRNVSAKGEAYVMNIDGSGKRRLTSNNQHEFSAGWSPDGLKVIYCRNWPDRLYSCNVDGSGESLMGTIQGSSSYSMTFSPDGLYMVNVCNMAGGGVPQVSGEVIISEYVSDGMSPPIIKDPTNVTNNSGSRISDGLPTFIPGTTNYRLIWPAAQPGPSGNFSDATHELTLGRIQDHGRGASPRFEIVDREVIRTDGISGLVFSPDARKVIFVRKYPSQGIFVADWNDDGVNPPTFSNERRLTGLSGTETPRAWMR